MTTEEMLKNSSESPTTMVVPRTLLSLPYDNVLNCLARVSEIYHPSFSFVSKSFRSIIASPEFHAARARMGKNENRHYVCLDLNLINNPGPQWFALSTIPKQRKLRPIPSFRWLHYPQHPTVVIRLRDCFVKGKRSNRVFLFDCRSNQWRKLPKLRVGRVTPDVIVTDGLIHVIGGCSNC